MVVKKTLLLFRLDKELFTKPTHHVQDRLAQGDSSSSCSLFNQMGMKLWSWNRTNDRADIAILVIQVCR